MSLQGIYPTWLGESGGPTTIIERTVPVDSIGADLAGPDSVTIDDDELLVSVEPGPDSDLDGGISADLTADIDVDLECQ